MRKLSAYGPSIVVLVTAVVVLFLGPTAVRQLTYEHTSAQMIQASNRLAENDILGRINGAFRDIAILVEPSVVHISARQEVPKRPGFTSLSSGSGWVYDEEGHIVTNWHVVRDAQRIDVQMSSGFLKEAEIVGYDPTTDIAVLKVEPGRLHPAQLASLDDPVQQGDLVFAFGSPFDFRFSMSAGVVSGRDRHVGVIHDPSGGNGYESFIQVDAAINPGNSGGPLTDHRGRVIGMNTAIATGRSGHLEEGQFAGIGLAIPLEMIEPVVTQIIETGVVAKGLLGVVSLPLNVKAAQRFGFVGSGVLVVEVPEAGPAAMAGIEVDDIIMSVNDRLTSNTQQLRSIVSSMQPGEIATVTVWRPDLDGRSGEQLTFEVPLTRLDPLRDTGYVPADQDLDAIPQVGIAKMATSTRRLADDLGVRHHAGVMILEVVAGSGLAAQVPPGTIIVSVGGFPVENVQDFVDHLRQYNVRMGVEVDVQLPSGTHARVRLRVR